VAFTLFKAASVQKCEAQVLELHITNRGSESWRMNGSKLRERAHRLHNGEDSGGGPGSQRGNSRDIIVGDPWDQMIATMMLVMIVLKFRSPLLLPRKHVYM